MTTKNETATRKTLGDTSRMPVAFVQSELWWARSLDAREAYDRGGTHCCYGVSLQETAHEMTRVCEILSTLFDRINEGRPARYALIDSLKGLYRFHREWYATHEPHHEHSCRTR